MNEDLIPGAVPELGEASPIGEVFTKIAKYDSRKKKNKPELKEQKLKNQLANITNQNPIDSMMNCGGTLIEEVAEFEIGENVIVATVSEWKPSKKKRKPLGWKY